MFHLYEPDHIEWPVSVDLPAKAGLKKAYTFTAHFRVLDQEDCDDLNEQHNALIVATIKRYEALQSYRGSNDLEVLAEPLPCTYEDLAAEVLCGWGEEVVDEAGEPVEFTDAAKAKMLRMQGAASAIFNAWVASIGKPSAAGEPAKSAAKQGGFRAKNS
jgi:hypothetical protein